MENIIYKDDRIVLLAQYDDPKIHKHFSKHILLSDKPFLCNTVFQNITTHSVIIQSNVSHHIKRSADSKMIVFLIDETSRASQALDEIFLREKEVKVLPLDIERAMLELFKEDVSLEEFNNFADRKLIDKKVQKPIESRVLEAMRLVKQTESIERDIYDRICKKVFLSKSRFLHLFKEETGIDFKNYLLIKKLEKTYFYVTEKHMNITDASILAGFSSASHFSSTCKKHYGISFTDFLKAQNNQRPNESGAIKPLV